MLPILYVLAAPGSALWEAPRADAPHFALDARLQGTTLRLVRREGEWLQVESASGPERGELCSPTDGWASGYRLLWWIRADALRPATVAAIVHSWPDGTSLHVAPGAPVLPGDRPDTVRVNTWGLTLVVPTSWVTVGTEWTPEPDPFRGGRSSRPSGWKLTLGGPEVQVEGKASLGLELMDGDMVHVDTGCLDTRAHGLEVVLPNGAEEGILVGRFGGRDGGEQIRAMWTVPSGSPVYWPDGTVAGATTQERTGSIAPTDRGDRRCVTESTTIGWQRVPLELCFATTDVDTTSQPAERDVAVLLGNAGAVQQAQGDLPAALASYQQALEIRQRLAKADSSPDAQKGLSKSHEKLAEVQQAQGDLPAALASYQQALEIRRRLADAEPSASSSYRATQRDAAILFGNVGAVQQAQGDLPAALVSCRRALEIRLSLAKADSSPDAQKGLSKSHEKLAEVQQAQGDFPAALASYQQGLEIRQRLAEAEPSSAAALRDVAFLFGNVGAVQQAQGDLPAALASCQQALEIRQRLADADPSPDAQKGLSKSHENLAGVQQAQGDLPAALASYQQALEIRQRLAEAEPSSAAALRDVSILHDLVGDVEIAQTHFSNALLSLRASVEAARRATSLLPTSEPMAVLLAGKTNNLGWALELSLDLPGARAQYGQAATLYRRIVAASPTNADAALRLANALEGLGDVDRKTGNIRGAITSYQEELALSQAVWARQPGSDRAAKRAAQAMEYLADLPSSGITWRDVVAHFEAMDAQGLLPASDVPRLASARSKAAASGSHALQ